MAKTKSSSPKTAWQGALSFGLITFPVRACTGARDEKISFNQICPTHKCKINMPILCKGDGTPESEHRPEKADLLKGYEHQKGSFVYFSKTEIEASAPETSKAMEILQFVKADAIDAIYLDASYLLTPGEGGGKPFRLLRLAMEAGAWIALAKITMHGTEHLAALRPYRDGLMMHTLYRASEVRQLTIDQPSADVNPAELAICGQLIDALAAPFDPEQFPDERMATVRALIAAKIADPNATSAAAPEAAKKPPVADMMAGLQASLAALKAKGAAAA